MIAQTDKDKTILGNTDMSVDEKERYGLFYDEYKKFGVADLTDTGKVLTIETNWNNRVSKNEVLRLKFGDETLVVRNDDLRSILKILAPLAEAEQLLSHSKRFYTRKDYLVKIRTSRSYHRGEEIVLRLNLPERVV